MAGLVLSGATAIPLAWELKLLAGWSGGNGWIASISDAVSDSYGSYPFLAYGTDWLAFAHFVIAIAFLGPLKDPVKNIWVIEFGIIASVLVIPAALIFGEVRSIPFAWRLVDCSFGIIALVPLILAWKWTKGLEERSGPDVR